MRALSLLFVIVFTVFDSIEVRSGSIEITPLILNFKGVIANDSIVIAYANFGSLLMSTDDEQSWKQKRVFPGGEIINVIQKKSSLIACNDRGQIATSNDAGESWTIQKQLNDSILAILQFREGYIARCKHSLLKLDSNFSVINTFELESPDLKSIPFGFNSFQPHYRQSIISFHEQVIVEIDSAKLLILDEQLRIIDTMSLKDHQIPGIYVTGFVLDSDSEYVYMKYCYTDSKRTLNSIYRLKDFISIEKVIDSLSIIDYYQVANGQVIIMKSGDPKNTDTTKLSGKFIYSYFNGFTLANGKQYIYGSRKILQTKDLKTNELRVISEYSDISFNKYPDYLNKDSYLFYTFGSHLYKTTNNGITFLPTIDKKDPKYQPNFHLYTINRTYYDVLANTLYMFGDPYVTNNGFMWTSKDQGRTFDSIAMDAYFRQSVLYFRNAYTQSGIQKRDDEFIMSEGFNTGKNKDIWSSLVTFKENGKLVQRIMDSTLIFTNVYSPRLNTYLVHACGVYDSLSKVLYTNDAGKTWQNIHEYPINETIGDIIDVSMNGRNYWILTHYDYSKPDYLKGIYLDVVDKETMQFNRIAQWGSETDQQYGMYGVYVTSYKDTAYIAFQDTLFVTQNLFDKKRWNYHLLPENGRMIKPKKFEDKFYCNYTDNNSPYGIGVSWVKFTEPVISHVEESEFEANGYLYANPPMPNPAKNSVKSHIVWDAHYSYEDLEIKIYDVNGVLVNSGENISFQEISANSGIIDWNCSGQASGIYVISIKHPLKTISIKCIVGN
jgi:hypothetical protein